MGKVKSRRLALEYVSRYEGSIKRLAEKHFRGDPDEQEEAIQEAWIHLYYKAHSWRGDCAFSSWAYRVFTNCFLMRIRKVRKANVARLELTNITDRFGAIYEVTPESLHDKMTPERILSARQELALTLIAGRHFIDGFPLMIRAQVFNDDFHAVSKRFKLSVPAIKGRLFRGRAALPRYFKQIHDPINLADVLPKVVNG